MFELQCPSPQGNLYLVTDSHLDETAAPYTEFIQLLDALPEVHTLICLGDLFKVWLADPKFWAPLHTEVLAAFARLQQRAHYVILVAGNREFLLPRNEAQLHSSPLPFTHLTLGKGYLRWGEERYGFAHGDTVNPHDKSYLRWRSLSHSLPFEALFRSLPGHLARKISEHLEGQLAHTNHAFKISFPEAELQRYATEVLPEVDQFFLGHFHTSWSWTLPGTHRQLHVVPDWLGTRKVWRIAPDGSRAEFTFPR